MSPEQENRLAQEIQDASRQGASFSLLEVRERAMEIKIEGIMTDEYQTTQQTKEVVRGFVELFLERHDLKVV